MLCLFFGVSRLLSFLGLERFNERAEVILNTYHSDLYEGPLAIAMLVVFCQNKRAMMKFTFPLSTIRVLDQRLRAMNLSTHSLGCAPLVWLLPGWAAR